MCNDGVRTSCVAYQALIEIRQELFLLHSFNGREGFFSFLQRLEQFKVWIFQSLCPKDHIVLFLFFYDKNLQIVKW